jgi:hypothetical protein
MSTTTAANIASASTSIVALEVVLLVLFPR